VIKRAIQSKAIGKVISGWQSLIKVEYSFRMLICQPNLTAGTGFDKRFVVSISYRGTFILAFILAQVQLFAEQAYRPSVTTLRQQAAELEDAGRLLEAATAYRKALTLDPAWADGWWQLGTVEYDLGNFRVSRTALKTFLSFEPKSGSGTGLTALRIALLPKDVAVSKQDLISRTGQAVCNATADRSEKANAQFAALIREYPATPQLHYLYGCFLLKNHSADGLAQLMEELTISQSHVPAMVQIALEYRRRGDDQKALLYAERAVKLNPQNERAQFVMGRTLVDCGRLTDGIEHLRHALALAPSDRATLWALSLAEAKSGNEKKAQQIRSKLSRAEREAAGSAQEEQN
jgi:tetratricopeptide (TPR) repeat protein